MISCLARMAGWSPGPNGYAVAMRVSPSPNPAAVCGLRGANGLWPCAVGTVFGALEGLLTVVVSVTTVVALGGLVMSGLRAIFAALKRA